MQMEAELRAMLLGHFCIDVMYREESYDWVFSFNDSRSLNADCPWRIIAENRVVLGYEDHWHQFGLPEPVDGQRRALDRLSNRAICGVRTRDDSGDLWIEFEGGNLLELFNCSGGYEGWQLHSDEKAIAGLGGGRIALFQPTPGNAQMWIEKRTPAAGPNFAERSKF